MKKLVLGTLFLALCALQTTGCTSSSGDDIGDDDIADRTITATWSLHNLASAQANLPCPPGTETAAVYTAPIDTNYNTIDAETTVDLFDCDARTGTTDGLFADKYQTWIELTDDVTGAGASIDHGDVYAASPRWPDTLIEADREDIVDLTSSSSKSISFALIADGGYFAAGWSLEGGQTCAQAGSDGVSILATEVNGPVNSADDIFNCEAGFGITGAFANGNYTIAITATDGPTKIGDSTTKTASITGPNKVTDLGDVVIPVD